MRTHVQVDGLTELRRALRSVEDPTQKKEVRGGFKAAADVVAQDARTRVPARSGRARKSVRSGAAWQKGSLQAFVLGGKAAVPYYGWLDFGSRTPRRGNPRSVGPWAGSGKGPQDGRFIYPAIDAREREVVELVRFAVSEALRKAGL